VKKTTHSGKNARVRQVASLLELKFGGGKLCAEGGWLGAKQQRVELVGGSGTAGETWSQSGENLEPGTATGSGRIP